MLKSLERIIKQNVLAANRQYKNSICRGLDGKAMAIHVITRVTTKTLTVAEQEKLDKRCIPKLGMKKIVRLIVIVQTAFVVEEKIIPWNARIATKIIATTKLIETAMVL